MVNGLGVFGWGVGGIEAEAVMLGQPMAMLIPEVVGFELTGKLPPGATATDLVLTVTQMLRKKGVVDKFVEFYGPGIAALSLPDRATIANMAPEYGATMGFFPVDDETLAYLRFTGRSDDHVAARRALRKENLLWHDPKREAALLRHARARSRQRRAVDRRARAPAGSRAAEDSRPRVAQGGRRRSSATRPAPTPKTSRAGSAKAASRRPARSPTRARSRPRTARSTSATAPS